MRELDVPKTNWQPIWENLQRAYGERGRFYHTLKHIGKILTMLDEICEEPSAVLQQVGASAVYLAGAVDSSPFAEG